MKNKILIIVLFSIVNTFSIENKYTIDGEYTYLEALTAIVKTSKRSIVGSEKALNIKRNFYIDNARFSDAVLMMQKNLYTDGYKLTLDTNMLYIASIDSTKEDKEKIYTVYQEYQQKYIVTTNLQEFLNAKYNDKLKQKEDSLKNDKEIRSQIKYIATLEIVGETTEKNKLKGIKVDPVKININLRDLKNIPLSTILEFRNEKSDERYNFSRKIKTFIIGDTSQHLTFGNEIRRESAVLESDRSLQKTYETYYDGLTLYLKKDFYKIRYRVGSSEINLLGIPDSLVFGSVDVERTNKGLMYGFLPFKGSNESTFNLYARLTMQQVGSGN